MIERIIIAGAGGQGIMLMGEVLAEACLKENRHVTWLPAYGAEVRGGTAHCMVTISDEEIGSPYIEKTDTLIAMNEPSLERFKARIRDNGLLIFNSSLGTKEIAKNKQTLAYPFTDISLELGNIKVANMVALGCYLAKKQTVDIKTVLAVIEDIAPKEKKNLVEINKRALLKGMELVKW